MSATFKWCQDTTKLDTCDKQVFFVNKFGTKIWFMNGKHHRENGPAIECANGTKEWYLNGKLHRENGPAIECANANKYWCLNDRYYLESHYWKEINK